MRVVLARAVSGVRARLAADLIDDAGASPVEFVLVGTLLTVLTLGVLQFGLAVYVRNVVHDAAVEGAYHAALADTTLGDGAERTRDIVGRTIGAGYATEVSVQETASLGQQTIEVRVRATLPLVGLLGASRGLEVTAHAPVESFG
ncbi:TadE/TadG family type IV pilus assembly protein [Microbacterium trichothecenolyticum]|uniref:TadE-like protein n=1 Tax=Microbacterium trichothecenolyticum TaxID=69370 RepID=A0A0M2HDR5_MICTR|nr:TadE/TadG family type IV pilus assembly protein [Microbacterium trichothecenolyticum]KJL44714.1 TadE-like protein [Microbacterium trichothecenolyticum]